MSTPSSRIPWSLLLAEAAGTALLVLVGLSLVILMFGAGTPMAALVPNEAVRRLITGFLFGTTGALIAVSAIGRESGAHINPIVTMGFWLMGKLNATLAAGYIVAQLCGAVAGSLPLLAWGAMGRSVAFGATLPGQGYSTPAVLAGEAVTTFLMVFGLMLCLGFRRLRPFTPALFPPLYALMVCLESPISGTSTNPARSLGPAVVSGMWDGWWIYWVGPLAGMLVALAVGNALASRIEIAKLYYFDSDRLGVLRRRPRVKGDRT